MIRNRFTTAQYQEVKNNTYTLVAFNSAGKRQVTYSGLSMYALNKELLKHVNTVLIFNDGELPRDDYKYNDIAWYRALKTELLSSK